MKKNKRLRRVSALTMAAVISTANVAWAYPPLLMSRAESTEEESVQTDELKAAESPYPTALGYKVERTEDNCVLKFSNNAYLKQFFDVKLAADGDTAVDADIFAEEGVVLSLDSSYSLSITPIKHDENENPITNPYDLVSDEPISVNVHGEDRELAKLRTKELNDKGAFEIIRYEGAEEGTPLYYGEKVIISPTEGHKANKVKGDSVIGSIESKEEIVIDDTDIVSARTKLEFNKEMLSIDTEKNRNYNFEDNSVLFGDTVVLEPKMQPAKRFVATVGDEKFVNSQVKFKADKDEIRVESKFEEVGFVPDSSMDGNKDVIITAEKDGDNFKIKYEKRKSVVLKSLTVVSEDKEVEKIEIDTDTESAADNLRGEHLLDGSKIHSEFSIIADYEINITFSLEKYYDDLKWDDFKENQLKVAVNGKTLDESLKTSDGEPLDFNELLKDDNNEVVFYADKRYTIKSIVYKNDKADFEDINYTDGMISKNDKGHDLFSSYSINVEDDMRGANEFTITFAHADYSDITFINDENKCVLDSSIKGNNSFDFTAKPKPGYYVSDIIYRQKYCDGKYGDAISVYSLTEKNPAVEADFNLYTDQQTLAVKCSASNVTANAEIEVVLSEVKEISQSNLRDMYALEPYVSVGNNGYVHDKPNASFGVRGDNYTVKLKEAVIEPSETDPDESEVMEKHEISGISCDPAFDGYYDFSNGEGHGFDRNEKGEFIKNKKHVFYIFDKTDNAVKKFYADVEKIDINIEISSVKVTSKTDPLRFLTFGIFGRDMLTVTAEAKCYAGNDNKKYESKISKIILIDNNENGKAADLENDTAKWEITSGKHELAVIATMTIEGKDSVDSDPYYLSVDALGKVCAVKDKGSLKKIYVEDADPKNAPDVDISAYTNNDDENAVFYYNNENDISTSDKNSSKNLFKLSERIERGKMNWDYRVYPNTLNTEMISTNYTVKYKKVFFNDKPDPERVIWTNNDFTYRIYSFDDVSGVNNISYKLNCGDNEDKNGTYSFIDDGMIKELDKGKAVAYDVSVSGDEGKKAKYTLNAYSEDNCGNATPDKEPVSMTVGIDKEKPVIKSITAEVIDENEDHVSDYTSGEWTNKRVKITVKVSDNNGSGIKDVLLSLDDDRFEKINKDFSNGEFTYIVEPNFNETIKFTAVDNVKNNSEAQEFTVKTENVVPNIISFSVEPVEGEVNGRGTDQDAGTDLNDADNGIIQTDYGFFFQNDVFVKVKAADDLAEDKYNSGIGSVKFVKEANTGGTEEVTPYSVDYENGEAVFKVEGGFKGQIAAVPIDVAGNTGSAQNPDSLITETEEKHKENSSLIISLPYDNGVKDASGLPLYSDNPVISFKAVDNHSGIRNIKYLVRSVETEEVYMQEAVNFDDVQSTDSTFDVSGWDITKERNIVTQAEKSITIDKDENEIEIWIWFEDNAGFSSEPVTKRISIDKTAPEIVSCELTGTAKNEKYYNADRTATIKIRERNLDKAKTEELINVQLSNELGAVAKGYSIGTWEDEAASNLEGAENNLHTITVTFNADAEYNFSMEAEDLTGKKAKCEVPKFVIDKTSPKLSLGFDNNSSSNGNYFNNNRKATITINEHNFDPKGQTWVLNAYEDDNITPVEKKADELKWTQSTSDPDVWTAQISFEKDGRYSFSLTYEDLAGNNGNSVSADFFIDKTAPVIEQTFTPNNKDRFATNSTYTPSVKFSDYNLFENGVNCEVKIKKIDINGSSNERFSPSSSKFSSAEHSKPAAYENVYDVFGDVEDKDGIYEISISAEDKAGNKVDNLHYTVSINRYGSTYAIVNEEAKDAIEKFKSNTPVNTEFNVIIQEVNVTELDGDSTITVIHDNSDTNILKNGDYTVTNARTGKEDNGWYEVNYTISKDSFENDGNYLVNIESNDSAGNKNSNNTPVFEERKCSVVFAIDRTLPEVIISGVEKDAKLKEAEADLKITCSDRNLRKASELSSDDLKVKINDLSYDVDDLRKLGAEVSNDASDNIIISLPVKTNKKNAKNDISVEIKDKAGNASLADKSSIRFELAASFFARHFSLSLVLIALGVIALGAGGVIVLKKVKNG